MVVFAYFVDVYPLDLGVRVRVMLTIRLFLGRAMGEATRIASCQLLSVVNA